MVALDDREARWVRNDGTFVHPASVPKGYSGTIARLLKALNQDPEWRAWWGGSGFEYLDLYTEFTNADSRLKLTERFMRRGDHIRTTFVVIFGPFDKQKWTVEQAQEHARDRLREFFERAAQRLRLPPPPPPPLPD